MTLSEVKEIIEQLAQKIDAPQKFLPTFDSYIDDGHPFIEVKEGQVFYAGKERGEEIYRYGPLDVDDLLYRAFEDVAWNMASKFEVGNRVKGPDQRRLLFMEQERILGVLDEKWRLKMKMKNEETLLKYPFRDKKI